MFSITRSRPVTALYSAALFLAATSIFASEQPAFALTPARLNAPSSIVIADLNVVGKLDLVVSTRTKYIHELLGNGDGR